MHNRAYSRVQVPCGSCGKIITIKLYKADRARYCSRKCLADFRRGSHDVRPRKPRPRLPLEERFWRKVVKSEGCWSWMGAKHVFGYGIISAGGRNPPMGAHCASWLIHYGPIPDGLFVLHRCDNPPCVRPDHLFLGTHTDNMRDMAAKGRQSKQRHHHDLASP